MHTNICAQSIQSVSQGAILSGLLSLDALREKTELNIFHEKYFLNRYVFKADLNEDMESSGTQKIIHIQRVLMWVMNIRI